MTFLEAKLALQLAAEERMGWLLREMERERRAAEDAAWEKAAATAAEMGV